MEDWIWSPFLQVAAGGLGLALGLGGLGRLRDRAPRGPGDRWSSLGLIVIGTVLVVIGALRLAGVHGGV
jgi:hypothetical protein